MYSYVCSLGDHCITSKRIKEMGLKKMSFPFDWIFSNTDMILECIEDDFKVFLDKSNYVSLPNSRCGHKIYHERMFEHHEPLKNADHYDYFIRCIARFRALLESEKPKLFIITSTNNSLPLDTSKIINFNNKFKKHTTNYKLLYIYHKNSGRLEHKFTDVEGIDILELHTHSVDTGFQFRTNGENDYLSNILRKKYSFDVETLQLSV